MLSRLSRVRLCAVPRTVARQAPPSMGFSRQEYWSGLPCPPPEDLTDPGIEPMSPLFQGHSLPLQCVGSPDLSQAQSNLCSSRKCSSLVPPAASNSTGRHQGIAGITGHHLSTRASQASQGITSPPGHPRHHRASPLHQGIPGITGHHLSTRVCNSPLCVCPAHLPVLSPWGEENILTW